MRMPSSSSCRLDLVPPLADRFILGSPPRLRPGTSPHALQIPSCANALDGHPALRSAREVLRPARLLTPAFGYGAPHLSARGTLTLLNNVLLSTHEEVISRPRFKRSEEIIASALRAIREKGFWVRPTTRLLVCADPDDNMFLECAQAARAEYVVTGNLKHFPPTWESTRIVTPRHLLDVALGKNNKERV